MTSNTPYRLFLWLTTLMLSGMAVHGQRVSFGAWAGSGLSIQPVANSTLNFGNIVKGVVTANTVTINNATVFEITAPEGYDLTVTIDALPVLTGPNSKTIPFNLKFAYSNQGLIESQARLNTVEVATGFNSVTFPVKRSALGLPAPPPTPLDGTNTTRTLVKAYLYLYGSAGPAGTNADAGEYTGTVNIMVEYASS